MLHLTDVETGKGHVRVHYSPILSTDNFGSR